MTRFQVSTEQRNGEVVYVLRDMHTRAIACIVPSLGGNCLELRLAVSDNEPPVAVIHDLEDLEKSRESRSRYGIPILFPWASGIADGAFQFDGKTIQLNKPGVRHSRHHGFVNSARWKVLRSDCDNTGAWLTCMIDSVDCGELASALPFRCQLQISWILRPGKFEMQLEARNTGTVAMPMGLGLHPYFTLPLGPRGSTEECRLEAQVTRQWDLSATAQIGPTDPPPTQVYLPQPEFKADVPGGNPLADVDFNFVYDAAFDPASKTTSASIVDPANRRRLTISASNEFGKWVFFRPKGRPVISLEPWTLAANGFNLAAKGVTTTGMVRLQPGEKWTGAVEIRLSAAVS